MLCPPGGVWNMASWHMQGSEHLKKSFKIRENSFNSLMYMFPAWPRLCCESPSCLCCLTALSYGSAAHPRCPWSVTVGGGWHLRYVKHLPGEKNIQAGSFLFIFQGHKEAGGNADFFSDLILCTLGVQPIFFKYRSHVEISNFSGLSTISSPPTPLYSSGND